MNNEKLVEQIKNGYHVTEFMQTLYENNLPLLKKFIQPYTYFESEEDLLQEAYFGLCNAVQNYDFSKNVLFMTYAKYWVQQSILQYIATSGSIIKIPDAYKQKIVRYKKAVQEFKQVYGHTPTDEQMAEYMLLSTSQIAKIKSYIKDIVSLDTPLKDDEDLKLSDIIADTYNLENEVIDKIFNEYKESELWSIVTHYTKDIQGKILCEYYKEGKTFSQIANAYSLTYTQVRQHKDDGLHRLRCDKAKQEILDKFEMAEASVYRTGIGRFREHGNSSVEFIAIKRLELEKMYSEKSSS